MIFKWPPLHVGYIEENNLIEDKIDGGKVDYVIFE